MFPGYEKRRGKSHFFFTLFYYLYNLFTFLLSLSLSLYVWTVLLLLCLCLTIWTVQTLPVFVCMIYTLVVPFPPLLRLSLCFLSHFLLVCVFFLPFFFTSFFVARFFFFTSTQFSVPSLSIYLFVPEYAFFCHKSGNPFF